MIYSQGGPSSRHTSSNAEGIDLIGQWLGDATSGLLFANLVDFDQLYGHRNNVAGFYNSLREFDFALPSLTSALREDDLLFITADHGNDPTTASTDHAREMVPLLTIGPRVRPGISAAADFFGSRRNRRRLVRCLISREGQIVSVPADPGMSEDGGRRAIRTRCVMRPSRQWKMRTLRIPDLGWVQRCVRSPARYSLGAMWRMRHTVKPFAPSEWLYRRLLQEERGSSRK